jgi:hypothetical protein
MHKKLTEEELLKEPFMLSNILQSLRVKGKIDTFSMAG